MKVSVPVTLADHAKHGQICQIGGVAPHEALPRRNALRPLIRAGVQSLPEVTLDAVLFDQATRDAVHQPRARHPRGLPLRKIEVAVLGDVVEGLPGLPQRAVDVDGEQLHKALVHPLPPLDLLSLLGFSYPSSLQAARDDILDLYRGRQWMLQCAQAVDWVRQWIGSCGGCCNA